MNESIRSLFTPEEWEIMKKLNPSVCEELRDAPLELRIEEERISEFHEQRFVEAAPQ